ncbi:hypothetical protein LTR37_002801 [Vermiconidia calcicola]|uniref:Uncharacterized protein n=1 Tax=Vermiconidia calcicola TaxID=1690605 RepID=A0ACC3NRT2_9PEZI|nr:hypothetical protein LTR37_002801 [Vermiconidia calcicola]
MGTHNEEPSVLIVGAGIFGTSTAYHLARKYGDPSRITVLDRTASPPDPAASTDINKIIRADYSSHFYCDLAYEALHAWATWPALRAFYHRTGWIMLDEEGSDLSDRIRQVFSDRGHDPTYDVPISELETHWKGIMRGTQLKGFKNAYWNPEAGWCDAAAATASLMEAAQKYGVKYATDDIKELCLEPGRVRCLRTASGHEYTADQIVLATGAWTSSILSPAEDALQIEDRDRVERQAQAAGVAVAHYKMSNAEMDRLSDMPVVVYGEHGEVIPPPKNCLLKYTNSNTFTNTFRTSSGHEISVPPDRDQRIVSDRLKRETEAMMAHKVIPTFTEGKQAEYWRLCWDARTPTQDWLLCRHPHPGLSNLYLAIGGSFHSYKFLPTAGKYMVNVLSESGNGAEKDRAWGWKKGDAGWRGAHEKTAPKRELRDLEDKDSTYTAKL